MSIRLLAQIGTNVLPGVSNNTPDALINVIKGLLTLAFVGGGILLMYNLFMGALNWIQSAGEKDKLEKARKQITNSLVGFIILILVWFLFFAITSNILGIFQLTGDGSYRFVLPSLF
ncbi:MAG: hypothetical protein WC775_03890 [Patescibacteria group bacterium]|jgi:hypothetical protein